MYRDRTGTLRILTILFLLLAILSAAAEVDIRIDPISLVFDSPEQDWNTLTFSLSVCSPDGDVGIAAFQGAIALNENFGAQNPLIAFSDVLFPEQRYQTTLDYDDRTGKIRFVFAHKSGVKSIIGEDWLAVLRVQIQYRDTDNSLGMDWSSLEPQYLVVDQEYNDVTGEKLEFPDLFAVETVVYDFPQVGLFLISIPGTAADMSVSALFPNAARCYSYENNSYILADDLEVGKGYFLLTNTPCTAHIKILPVFRYTRLIDSAGWHLVGSTFESSPISTNPQNCVSVPVLRYDTQLDQYVASPTIEPQLGYWAAFTRSCEVIVGQPAQTSNPENPEKQENDFIETFGNQPPSPPDVLQEIHTGSGSPDRFELFQNYPNPFNPETAIAFQLPRAGHVNITIYNANGQHVITLVDSFYEPGFHQVAWKGTDEHNSHVGAGVYLCKMITADRVFDRKLVLLK